MAASLSYNESDGMQVETEAARPAGKFSESRLFYLIVAIFLISRLALLSFNEAEFTDGYLFIQWAFDQSEIRHPLYPLCIQLFALIMDPVIAGRFVSSVAGFVCLLLLFAISRRLYGRTAATIAAGLFTIAPLLVWLHSRVLSESLFLAFFLAALFYFLRGMDEDRYENLFFQIFFSGLAMLTRPEGVVFLPLLLYSLYERWRRGDRKGLLYSLPAFLPWLLFGVWTVISGSGYRSIMEISINQFSFRNFLTYFVVYLESYPYIMCYPVFALALIGLFRREPVRNRQWLILLMYFQIMWFLTISVHRWWSTRFLIVPLTLLIVEAAGALEFLKGRMRYRNWYALILITTLCSVVLAGTSLYYQKQIFADVKASALFVRERFGSHRLFSDEKTKVSYYSRSYVHPIEPNSSFQRGDVLILNSFYTPLRKSLESLSRQYDIALLHQSDARAVPILANINTEKSLETHLPEKLVWRFETQKFRSLVIGIVSRKR